MKRPFDPKRYIGLSACALILTMGLWRLYGVRQDSACHMNSELDLADMMQKLPDGAHTVPGGMTVNREIVDWVAPAGYELHAYPSVRSEFVRVTGPQSGWAKCSVLDQDGTNWLVLGIPDPAQAGLNGPRESILRYIREDMVKTNVRP